MEHLVFLGPDFFEGIVLCKWPMRDKVYTPQLHSLWSEWFLRLFRYDGLLPAMTYLVPGILHFLFRIPPLVELSAVVCPIVAFLYRAFRASQQIECNRCPRFLRRIQKVTMLLGLLALVLVDAFVALSWLLPAQALSAADHATTLAIYLIYLVLMAFSTYPGINRVAVTEPT